MLGGAVRRGRPGNRRRVMRTARLTATRALLLAVATLAIACGEGAYQPARPAELQRYMERYVALVNAGDVEGLRAHLANPGQPQDAGDRIRAHGRLGLQDIHVSVAPVKGFRDWYSVTLRARTRNGEDVRLNESVSWDDVPFEGASRWHWVMGPL